MSSVAGEAVNSLAGECSRFLALDEDAVRHPLDLFAALRAQPGLYRDEESGYFMVARHRDILEVLRDPDTFSSETALGPKIAGELGAIMAELSPSQQALLAAPGQIVCSDGALHARLRKLAGPAFTVRATRRWTDTIRQSCVEVIGKLFDGSGAPVTVDWVNDFARPIALHVIAQVLGVPPEDNEKFHRWVDALADLANGAQVTKDLVMAYLAAMEECQAYLTNRIRQARTATSESLLAQLASILEEGDRLSDEELFNLCLTLLAAGMDTIVRLLTSTALELARRPELIETLRTDPAEQIPTLIEAILRVDAPAVAIFRTATRDAEVAGTFVPHGAQLLVLYASGNRDGSVFPDPDLVDLEATSTGHLAFGHGAHHCLGAPLARLEAQIAIEEFINAVAAVELQTSADRLNFRPHLITPIVRELPVRLTPR